MSAQPTQPTQPTHNDHGIRVSPETAPSQVDDRLAHLEQVADVLAMTVERLEGRLFDVLRPVGTEASLTGSLSVAPVALVPLAGRLEALGETAGRAHLLLVDVLDRLEL